MLLGDIAAAVGGLYLVRSAFRPERLVDVRMLAVIAASVMAMLPACALGAWIARNLITDRVAQVLTGLAIGAVALARFGLVFALLTGALPDVDGASAGAGQGLRLPNGATSAAEQIAREFRVQRTRSVQRSDHFVVS